MSNKNHSFSSVFVFQETVSLCSPCCLRSGSVLKMTSNSQRASQGLRAYTICSLSNSFLFLSFPLPLFFSSSETGFLCVVLAVLELALSTRLILLKAKFSFPNTLLSVSHYFQLPKVITNNLVVYLTVWFRPGILNTVNIDPSGTIWKRCEALLSFHSSLPKRKSTLWMVDSRFQKSYHVQGWPTRNKKPSLTLQVLQDASDIKWWITSFWPSLFC